SFGFTGTNVHVVLEAPPPIPEQGALVAAEAAGNGTPPAAARERPLHVLKLSARDDAALNQLVHRWIGFLDSATEPFADICYTAVVGRADLPERLAVVARSAEEARERLAAFARGDVAPGVSRGRAADSRRTQVAFLFTGHGAQQLDMGRQLYETQPTFRAALERCEALLRPHLERPLLSVLYPRHGAETDSLLLRGMSYSQPALFAVEYALAQLWRSWGVEPAMVLGHSVGEYAAAVTAGVFSLEDGIRLVAARGRLMDELPERGAMLAIFATSEEVESLIAPHGRGVSVASINGPAEVVVSGEIAAIDSITDELSAREIEFRRLAVAQAGHSHLLDPILDDFEAVAATVRFSPPQIELVSCTTGQPVSASETGDPRYWRRHLRQPVRFAAGIETLRREGCELFLEIGPHTNLVGMGSRCLPEEPELAWLPSLRRDWDDWQQMLESLAALYVRGVEVDWSAFERDYLNAGAAPRRRIPVPTYPWQHRRYWLEHAPRGGRKAEALAAGKTWESLVDAGRRQELQGPLDLALQSFPARWRALERLSTQMIASTLRALGAFRAVGERRTAAECVVSLGILPRYERLVARWLRRLADAGILRAEGDTFTAEVPLDAGALEPAWREAESALQDWDFMLEYLRRCGELLPAVLTGRANALETIFPDGSFATADALYRDSVLPRYYNAVAAAVVSAFVEARRGQPVRAIELGGGTGGTTATLAPLIERVGGSYHFTDVSDHFLARAAERLGGSGKLSFGLLDVDRDPREQGYSAGSFDLVIAANVLHTAHDIPATLAHMRSLLAPGGLLLLVEVTSYLDWFDVSTALLEGWDRQADALRPDHPMLSAAAWESAIREAGFAEVAAFPAPGTAAEFLAQHLLVAQAPLAPSAVPHALAAHSGARSNGAAAIGPETATTEAPDAFAARVASAAPHEREDLLVEYVRRHIAALLRLDSPQLVERRGRLMELGLDSLMAVELRSRLSRGLPLAEPLPATLVFDYPTVEAIVQLLSRRLDSPTPPEPAGSVATAETAVDSAPEELDGLTDEEVEARLLARLELIEERIR
ncbi:MAG TPA: acyltransferase domain-containing protein, partial [Longimicrobiaceae bacterium]|nr:acyltransferase domain-containing protein [Longimicrobiaceae bacterium]